MGMQAKKTTHLLVLYRSILAKHMLALTACPPRQSEAAMMMNRIHMAVLIVSRETILILSRDERRWKAGPWVAPPTIGIRTRMPHCSVPAPKSLNVLEDSRTKFDSVLERPQPGHTLTIDGGLVSGPVLLLL